jgi:hypothetical protein
MRFYAISNSYLSSIQHGIQAFHCLGEMVLNSADDENNAIYNWLANHKTVVCLNGGNNKSLTEFYELIKDNTLYPVAKFHEDEDSMNGMLTCVGIIIPETIYKANLDEPDDSLTPWEFELATRLRRMPTAR